LNLASKRPTADDLRCAMVDGCHRDAASIIGAAQRRARRSASAGLIATTVRRRVELPRFSNSAEGAKVSTAYPTAAATVDVQPRLAAPPPQAHGVSAAFLCTHMVEHRQSADAPEDQHTTRWLAENLKRRMQSDEESGPYIEKLCGEYHAVTQGRMAGKAAVYVAHAWDAPVSELVDIVLADAGGNLDVCYAVDVFTADLHDPPSDPVAAVRQAVTGVSDFLLALDSQAIAFHRLWVLFEAMVAVGIGKKFRVRCASPDGFGSSERALKMWEAHVDAIDWVLSESSRKSDERRIRSYAARTWEQNGKGVERMLAQLKTVLRREIYGQILISAVEAGDKVAVLAALEMGVNPEQQDAMGNTAEELASFNGFTDIEELLFEKRMTGQTHLTLTAFFAPKELEKAQESADPAVLEPFMATMLTEFGGFELTGRVDGADDNDGSEASFDLDALYAAA